MPETHQALIKKATQLGVSLDEIGDNQGNISIPILQERIRSAQTHRHNRKALFIMVVALVVALFSLVLSLTGCSLGSTWQGVYYPDGCLTCTDKWIYSPVYHSKEDCFNWAARTKQSRGNNDSDDWECGRDCKTKDSGMMVCKETVDN